MENHDQARSVSRMLGFGADSTKKHFDFQTYEADLKKYWSVGAKLLAILHTTQGGTVFIYQGEEIGSTNVPRSWPLQEYKDLATINLYREELERRKKSGEAEPDMTDVMDGINRKARDNARVPVQWDDSPHAGFTTGTPWMRVNDNYTTINVKDQENDESSILSFWKKMIQLRKDYPVMIHGDFTLLSEKDEKIFAYTREYEGTKALVVMNFSRENVRYELPDGLAVFSSKIIGGNMLGGQDDSKLGTKLKLEPYEGQIWLISP
ncbi:hypothetical protein FRC09_012945 [Ceratobasidium sp. 395]|nr:hypothetical protein FRC09_012945 [Ceratobasidium sp. 395]